MINMNSKSFLKISTRTTAITVILILVFCGVAEAKNPIAIDGSPSGMYIAIGYDNGLIELRKTEGEALFKNIKISGGVSALRFLNDSVIVVGNQFANIYTWKIDKKKPEKIKLPQWNSGNKIFGITFSWDKAPISTTAKAKRMYVATFKGVVVYNVQNPNHIKPSPELYKGDKVAAFPDNTIYTVFKNKLLEWKSQYTDYEETTLLTKNSIESVAISLDKKYLVFNDKNTAQILDISSKQIIGTLSHDDNIIDLEFVNSVHLFSSSSDGTIKLWNVRTQQLIATFTHGEAITNATYHPASRKLLIASRSKTRRAIPIHPNLLALDALYVEKVSDNINEADRTIRFNVQYPTLRKDEFLFKKDEFIMAQHNQKALRTRRIASEDTTMMTIQLPNYNSYAIAFSIGEVALNYYEKNPDLPVTINYEYFTSQPLNFRYLAVATENLYVLSIGPKVEDLKYTSTDALNISEQYQKQWKYNEVFVKQLVGEVKRSDIYNAINISNTTLRNEVWGETVPAPKPEDVFILFYSTHGERDLGDYLLHTSDALSDADKVSFRRLVTEIVKNVPSERIYIFLDACYSGQGEQAISTNLKTDIDAELKATGRRQSVVVLASCQDKETSEELEGNGLFTRYFIQGIKGDADLNDDSEITISELYNYLDININLFFKNKKRVQGQQPVQYEYQFNKNLPKSKHVIFYVE